MSPSSVKRTELIKTNFPLPFVKKNITLEHMDYMRAKVPGGCHLQFDQIARDVQCRMPSSKDDIMRSTWFCYYSNCDNCFNAFREENCCYRSKASPLSFLFVTCRPYPLLKPFGYGQETEQLTFKLKQAGMLENAVDFWGTIIYSLNMD